VCVCVFVRIKNVYNRSFFDFFLQCFMKCMISKLGLVSFLSETLFRAKRLCVTRTQTARKTFHLFQLNDDGTYNKTGMGEGLKKYWPEWPLDKIELINNKCHDEGETIYIYIYTFRSAVSVHDNINNNNNNKSYVLINCPRRRKCFVRTNGLCGIIYDSGVNA